MVSFRNYFLLHPHYVLFPHLLFYFALVIKTSHPWDLSFERGDIPGPILGNVDGWGVTMHMPQKLFFLEFCC
jgi:hypothetical protein